MMRDRCSPPVTPIDRPVSMVEVSSLVHRDMLIEIEADAVMS